MPDIDLLANRYHFLGAVAAVNPNVLKRLRDVAKRLDGSDLERVKLRETEIEALSLRRALGSAAAGTDSSTAIQPLKELEGYQSPIPALGNSLAAWAKQFGLTDAWIIDCAVETIASWRHGTCVEEGAAEARFRWAFRDGKRAFVMQRIRKETHDVARHCRDDESFPDDASGYVADSPLSDQLYLIWADVMYLRGYEDEITDFTEFDFGFWALALFQTRGASPAEILASLKGAGWSSGSEKGVCLAYRRAARSIGLTLREARRGPKRKPVLAGSAKA